MSRKRICSTFKVLSYWVNSDSYVLNFQNEIVQFHTDVCSQHFELQQMSKLEKYFHSIAIMLKNSSNIFNNIITQKRTILPSLTMNCLFLDNVSFKIHFHILELDTLVALMLFCGRTSFEMIQRKVSFSKMSVALIDKADK